MPAPTLDDLLASARTAKQTRRPHRDVNVTLDADVAEQIEAIDRRIADLEQQQGEVADAADQALEAAARDARMASPARDQITADRDAQLLQISEQLSALEQERDDLAEGTVVTLRFEQLPGHAWAEIGARHPARVDVAIDRAYGYNYHAVATDAALYHDPATLPGGPEGRGYVFQVVAPDGDGAEPAVVPITDEQMAGILDVVTGHEYERVASTIWELNDYGPQQRLARAGKASRAGSANRSNSPELPASAPSDSEAGSPPAS